MSNYPTWISSLNTASIASDMKAADVNGVVSYAGLTKLLTDLNSTLSSSSTLTAQEFADLETIAANLTNGLSTSDYLTYVFNALVNGNAANATWTGGGASSVALGNLTVGSTATQFSELIGKWFLGTDLPSSAVTLYGKNGAVTNTTITYSTRSLPLFGASGPTINDVNQSGLGDCYFLAPCAELALEDPSIITSMFTDNGNGTYGVRFFENGVAQYVTVNLELADGGTKIVNRAYSDVWATLAEKAYAQLQTSGPYGASHNDGNSYTTIGNGGDPLYAMEALTDATSLTEYAAKGKMWTGYEFNSSLAQTSHTSNVSTKSVLDAILADLAAGDDVVLDSKTGAKDSSGDDTLVAGHEMSIYGYESASGDLEIRNPWGAAPHQHWDTTFEVSLSTLLSDGDTINTDNAGAMVPSDLVGPISVSAAYVAANIDALNANSQISSITLTDAGTPVLNLTASQAADETRVLNEITNGIFEVTAPGVEPTFYVHGRGPGGVALALYASSSAVSLAGNSRMDLYGSGDSLTAGANSTFDVAGGGNAITAASSDAVTLSATKSAWDSISGSKETIDFISAQAKVTGGADRIVFEESSGNSASLFSTANAWDLITGSNGYIDLTSAKATVTGGADSILFEGGSGNVASLFSTANAWDAIAGSNGTIELTSAQAKVTGGNDTIDFIGGSGNLASLFSTANARDTIAGSNGTIELTSAQAQVTGGADTIIFEGGSGNAASLFSTASSWDTIDGSMGTISETSAQANVTGGFDAIHLTNSSASVKGASDVMTFSGNDTLTASGPNESFVFGAAMGRSTIAGFNSTDTFTLSTSDFADWTALQPHVAQSGANTTLTFDAAEVLTLVDVTASSLTASEFKFV